MVNQGTQTESEIGEIARELGREILIRHVEMGRVPSAEGEMGVNPARESALDQVFALKRINPHVPIAWPHWPKGLWPKAVAAMQKVVRRLLRWYIDPIVEQQNAYNAEVAAMLALLHSRSQAQEKALTDLLAGLVETDSADE